LFTVIPLFDFTMSNSSDEWGWFVDTEHHCPPIQLAPWREIPPGIPRFNDGDPDDDFDSIEYIECAPPSRMRCINNHFVNGSDALREMVHYMFLCLFTYGILPRSVLK